MKNNKLQKILLFSLLTALFVLLTSGCGTSTAETRETSAVNEPEQTLARSVKVEHAELGDVEEVLVRATTISSPNTVSVKPRISGQIEYLNAEEGQVVKKGQLIARLEARQLELSMKRAEASRDKANHDLGLALRQYQANVIGKEDYLQTEYVARQAEKDYQSAKLEFAKSDIYSPISGVIAERHVSVGDTIFNSSPIVTITDNARLEANILVPQDQIDSITIGNRVAFLPNGDPNRAFHGFIDRISPVVSTETGTIKVIAKVAANQTGVRSGQFVKALIITGIRDNVVLVPKTAIVTENAMAVLYKVVDGFAKRVPVEIGYVKDLYVQVSGEIFGGDQVVVTGLSGLEDMTRVDVLPNNFSEKTYASLK